MIDSKRRTTLKLLGGSGVGLAMTTVPAVAALSGLSSPVLQELPAKAPRGRSELEITLISTTMVPGDTVLLQNHTDAALTIETFKPGTIVFGDKVVNLDAITAGRRLTVEPGVPFSVPVKVFNLLAAAPKINEYVWADDSIEPISDFTEVVHLGAFFVDHQALVFPATVPVIAAQA